LEDKRDRRRDRGGDDGHLGVEHRRAKIKLPRVDRPDRNGPLELARVEVYPNYPPCPTLRLDRQAD